MNVLTQDMARQFLNSSSPHEKYKYFMKGTQLEHLDHDYLIVEQNLETIEAEVWKKAQDLELFREEARKAEHLNAQAQQQDALRERINVIANQMAWVQVENEEKKLQGGDKIIQKMNALIEGLKMKASGMSEAFSQTEKADEHAKRVVDEARTGLAPLEGEKVQVKAEHDKSKAEQMSLQVMLLFVV